MRGRRGPGCCPRRAGRAQACPQPLLARGSSQPWTGPQVKASPWCTRSLLPKVVNRIDPMRRCKCPADSMGYMNGSLLPSPDGLLKPEARSKNPVLSLPVSVEADGESSSGPRDSGLLWCHQPPPQQGGPGKSQEQLQRPDVQADGGPVCAVPVDRWTVLPREDQEGKPFLPGPSSQAQHLSAHPLA